MFEKSKKRGKKQPESQSKQKQKQKQKEITVEEDESGEVAMLSDESEEAEAGGRHGLGERNNSK